MRFDYVKYDEKAQAQQLRVKKAAMELELAIEEISLNSGQRYKALALTALEECDAWAGKFVRDSLVARGGSTEDMTERGEG